MREGRDCDPLFCLLFLTTDLFHEIPDGFGMSALNDDLVVANGTVEQIVFQIDLQLNLRAAEMVAVVDRQSLGFGHEKLFHSFAAPFQ